MQCSICLDTPESSWPVTIPFSFFGNPGNTRFQKRIVFRFPCTVCEATTFLAIDKPSRHQELSTTINLSTCDHVIQVGGIGSTLTGGIQDIATILPLLGTEQWTYYTTFTGGKLRRWQIDHVTSRAKTEGWVFFFFFFFFFFLNCKSIYFIKNNAKNRKRL